MFGDRVLIDPDPKHEQSEGGLFIPPAVLKDNPNYYNMTGVVLQLGDGVMRHTFQCINCLALAPQDEGPCPGCHQPLGNKNTRLFEAGDGRYEFGVSVGERVLFNRFAGKQVEISAPHSPAPKSSAMAGSYRQVSGDRTMSANETHADHARDRNPWRRRRGASHRPRLPGAEVGPRVDGLTV
jgi:co-chaperonin GroES (HSP10)